jgi:hypothetical protein
LAVTKKLPTKGEGKKMSLFFSSAANKLIIHNKQQPINLNFCTSWTIPAMCLQQISTRLFRGSFADIQSQVRGFTGARLGSVPLGRHFRFGGSQS